MKQDFDFRRNPWHDQHCRGCDICAPRGPQPEPGFPLAWSFGLLVAGVATAFAIDFVIDRLADGPGVFALFGWS